MAGNKSFPTTSNGTKVPISISTGTTTTVVAAVAGQTVTLLYLYLWVASGAQTIALNDGASPGAFTGVMTIGLASGMTQNLTCDFHDMPLNLSKGNAFTITTTTSVAVSGFLVYMQGAI